MARVSKLGFEKLSVTAENDKLLSIIQQLSQFYLFRYTPRENDSMLQLNQPIGMPNIIDY